MASVTRGPFSGESLPWLGLLPAEGQDLILAGAILSITLNLLVFRAVEALEGVRRTPVATPAAARGQDTHEP